MSENTRDLTKGPVWWALVIMSAPMSLGILAVLSVGLVDAFFLGKIGGNALAAVGYIYPVTAAVTSLSIGLSAGANAMISQALGAGDDDDAAARNAIQALSFGVLMAALASLTLYVLHQPLFSIMGASDEVLTEIAAFMPWWCLSFPFAVTTMLINALFRAHGSSAVSAGFMVSEAVINIGLTPLFIFGWAFVPGFETAGAAMATFTARALIAGCSLTYAFHTGIISTCGAPFKNASNTVKGLLNVGAPAAISNAINPAGMALVTAAVATVGEAAVGGFGAATRIQSLALVPMFALSSGIGPVVGQNWGAEKYDRAAAAMKWAFVFCLGYGLAVGAVMFVFAEQLATLVASGGDATEFGATYLRVVGWSIFGYGFVVTANAAMNARSKAVWSMGLSLGRIFVVYLPAAWIGVTVLDYLGITYAAVLANVLAAIAAVGAVWMTGLFRSKKMDAAFA
ncbi:MATE family efflux transporter [Yoonia sp. 208BN28-4]|uniref:MATE family efflux transporter n=1 Tax=Yoonia sp. 208BN28-4 TaxID=3126505 RepID=UPI0030A4FE67